MSTFTNQAADPAAASNPYMQPPPMPGAMPYNTSPGLAFMLGWIPGVGAIYNGQYIKGLVHAVIFGILITMAESAPGSGEALIGMMIAAFVFYMPFEAYHTAKKRQMGLPVDEMSSLVSRTAYSTRLPVGPVILIVIGVLFLLDSLRIVEFQQIGRFWPVLLIVAGAYMLYARVSGTAAPSAPAPPREVAEARREQ
jgi:cell wall-active antibiotic response 4TMS protein YvqF